MAERKKVVTPVFRLSFPNLFEARAQEGGKPKFGCSAIWDKSKFSDADNKRWKQMVDMLNEVAHDRFKKRLKDFPANWHKGIRDGMEKEDLEGYGKGKKFAALTSKMRPGVIDRDKTPIGEEHGNMDEIYPGCWCRATVTAFAFDNQSKGVTLGLNNIQKVKDGERLDSRTDAEDDFEDDLDGEWADDDDEFGDDDADEDEDGL